MVLPARFLTVFGPRLDDVRTVGARYGIVRPPTTTVAHGPPQRLFVMLMVLPAPMKLTSPPLMDTDEPPLRNRPARATSSVGSGLNAGPRESMLWLWPVRKVPACRTGWAVPGGVAGASGSVSTPRFAPPGRSNIAALIVCEPAKPPLNVNSESV